MAEKLLKWITQVGIPHEILTDQGTNFMSGVMMLGITHLRMSVYHLQISGLVERLNSTLKRMIQRSTQSDTHLIQVGHIIVPIIRT